ncbi:UNVERIFIED_CONTAM: hypothetical protein FKN15_036457 [Acipenser sinensis]
MVGFGADGDAVMPGITKGLAAVLKQDFPWMIPVHCMAHRLEPTPTDVIREEKQNMNSHNGPKLQEFLQEVIGNQLKGVELRVSQEDDQPFLNLRSRVIKTLTSHLEERFQSLKSNEVLSAAAVMDPRKWPSDQDELVSHGNKAVAYLSEHFKQLLSSNGCSMEEVVFEWMAAKVHIIDTPRSQWCNVWKDMFADPILQNRFSNLLHLIELSLVILLSTAECERRFSCMK